MPRLRKVRQAGAQSNDVEREFLCAILQFLAHLSSIRNSHVGNRNCNPRDARYPSFHRHDSKNSTMAGTWLGRAGVGGGLLAFELDVAGSADGLSVFSALAWLRFGGRCRGLDARG